MRASMVPIRSIRPEAVIPLTVALLGGAILIWWAFLIVTGRVDDGHRCEEVGGVPVKSSEGWLCVDESVVTPYPDR